LLDQKTKQKSQENFYASARLAVFSFRHITLNTHQKPLPPSQVILSCGHIFFDDRFSFIITHEPFRPQQGQLPDQTFHTDGVRYHTNSPGFYRLCEN